MRIQPLLVLGFVSLLGLFLLSSWRPNFAKPEASSVSLLSTEKSLYDFGEISMSKGKVSSAFKIKNNQSNDVILTKTYTSCMCTEAKIIKGDEDFGPFGMPGHGPTPKINLKFLPGEEASVEVVFDPAAHGPAGVGRVERSVSLEQKGAKPLELVIRANVTP